MNAWENTEPDSSFHFLYNYPTYPPSTWGCRIHQHLCWGVRPANECPVYDIKEFDGGFPVMLELWGMRNTHSMLLLSGSFWFGVLAPDRILSMGQVKLNCVLILNWIARNRTVLTFKLPAYAKLNSLKWNCFWHRNCTYSKLNYLK